MEGKVLLRSLKLRNILSYGSEGVEVELQPLNIIVGPNGSGKSNLIEVFRLLQATTRDLAQPFIHGGGVNEWIWKGANSSKAAEITAITEYPLLNLEMLHALAFASSGYTIGMQREQVGIRTIGDTTNFQPVYALEQGTANIQAKTETGTEENDFSPQLFVWREIGLDKLRVDQSILSQRNSPEIYPALSLLNSGYQNMAFYTDARFGRDAAVRNPQQADAYPFFLDSDASNLALVLNSFQMRPDVRQQIVENLQLFYSRVEDFITYVQFGTAQLFFRERGFDTPTPAARLSDGTLSFLCLLTILCHPSPPPLICIGEPELGLHPDILPTLAKLLIEASQRTQLIITTHSDILLSEFADIPEAVIVCDRDDNGTSLKHLDREELQLWLRDYSLGEAWLKNAFGGTRW